jgi:acyl dehydratase
MIGIRYFEDLRVGQTFASEPRTIDAAAIKGFAAEFDPQPFHLDEDEARHSPFAGLAASG